jgi:hypothetical protein
METNKDNAVLYNILIRVEKKLDDHIDDHEQRLRALEHSQARNAGIAGVVGSALALVGAWLLSLFKAPQ